MEVPVEERPLAVPIEIHYIQPIMTSATTWKEDNPKPSFGCTVTGPYFQSALPWKMFDGSGTGYQDYWSWHNTDKTKTVTATLKFEHPLKVQSFSIKGCSIPVRVSFYAVDNEREIELKTIDLTDYKATPFMEVETKCYTDTFKFQMAYIEDKTFIGFNGLQLNALYRPADLT